MTNYDFKSLGIKTNLLLDSLSSQIIERKDYFVIQTPSRPHYFWGNYILMKSAPYRGCFQRWVDIFEKEVGERDKRGFCAITYDRNKNKVCEDEVYEFKLNGFRVEVDKILVCNQVRVPDKLNLKVQVHEYDLKDHMDEYIDIHFAPNWEYGSDDEQLAFNREQALSFIDVMEKGCGKRYAAYVNGEMAGDLGIYWDGGTVRFNNVATHRNFRRQGVCSRLVYEVSKSLIAKNPKSQLVMQADESYHAAQIYESIGFESIEKIVSLEWKDDFKFGAETL